MLIAFKYFKNQSFRQFFKRLGTFKELTDECENYKKVNNVEEVENIQKQIKIVESYLPQMMSQEEIKNVIMAMEDKSVPSVMKHFKANYAGKCDMRLVQEVLKNLG